MTEYIRALATWRIFGYLAASWSGKAKPLPHSESFGFFEHRVAQRDVGQRKSPMPEKVGLGVAFAARLQAGDDLSELRMQRRLGQLSCLDVCARSAPNWPALHCPQSSTTNFVMISVSDSSIALMVP